MTALRTAAQQALEVLESGLLVSHHAQVLIDLRAALAQQAEPVQEPITRLEPVAWRFEARHIDTAFGPAVSLKHPGPEHKYMRNVEPLYAAPPQRKQAQRDALLEALRVAAAEREACAKVCEDIGNRDANTHAWDAAAAIRARGNT